MKHTKFLSLLLATLLCMSIFTGCSNRGSTGGNENGTPPAQDNTKNNVADDVKNDIKDTAEDIKDTVDPNNDDRTNQNNNSTEKKDDTEKKADKEKKSSQASTSATIAKGTSLSTDLSKIGALDNSKLEWGPGGPVDEYNRSNGAVAYQERFGGYDADFIGENRSVIYLTFDEGYENGFTADILDVLKEKECPAVFFVTMPYVKGNPELVQRMIDEGHIVGNHSVNHPIMPETSLEDQTNEVMELHDYLMENFDYNMGLFRYPTGAFSEQSLALLQSLGYRSVFWSFAYRDWLVDDQPEPTAALQTLNEKMHPGAIYLLHAVSKTNTQILGQFIDDTREAGYSFELYPQN